MADKVIDSEKIVMRLGLWGQPVVSVNNIPTGGFTGASTHNVATAAAGIGETRAVYCDGSTGKAGWSVFTYLQVGTQHVGVILACKAVCVPADGTYWYKVSNDPDASILSKNSALCAIALSAMTDAYFGWFWTGGVCPEQYVSGLGGTYPTDDSVAAGGEFRVGDMTADALGFTSSMTTGTGASTTMYGSTGVSIAADVTGY